MAWNYINLRFLGVGGLDVVVLGEAGRQHAPDPVCIQLQGAAYLLDQLPR